MANFNVLTGEISVTYAVIIALICTLIAALITGFVFYFLHKKGKNAAENNADEIVKNANAKAENIVNEAKEKANSISEAALDSVRKSKQELSIAQAELETSKKAIIAAQNELEEAKRNGEEIKKAAEKEIAEKKEELKKSENKLDQREASLDKREDAIIQREEQLDERRAQYDEKIKDLEGKESLLDEKLASCYSELQRVANLTESQAQEELLAKVEEKEAKRIALYKEQMQEQAESECEDRAKILLANAMEKYSQEVTTERNSSTISLPSDDMKGRIIGREGRNIKSMEQLFGVSLIIDDTPETLTVSCFDPIRREKAKLTLESLIRDGRIQPGRIEDLYQKISKEFDDKLKRIGEQTVFKLGLPRINSGLLPYIGRLHYRTSYGQNVLDHSIQVSYLASVMASELGLDPIMAKRAGLLHDIGKSIDAEQEGSHVQLGSQLAKKFNEPAIVINAIESHHGDVPKTNIISELVTAADTLSAARPGARSETLETYIKRLEQIEGICKSFDGVQSSYALQSGRDVRVMVVPEKISDEDAKVMAVQIRERIENEMEFPGQIKISVIRETRAVETAK